MNKHVVQKRSWELCDTKFEIIIDQCAYHIDPLWPFAKQQLTKSLLYQNIVFAIKIISK